MFGKYHALKKVKKKNKIKVSVAPVPLIPF